jgi:putative membrane protein
MAVDRTLEAWIRTAVSLIGFGFTIVQFFAILKGMKGVAPPKYPELANYVGLMLIGLGTISLLLALWQHRGSRKHLYSAQYEQLFESVKRPVWSPTFVAGLGLCIVGMVAFSAVLMRVLLW